MTEGVEARGGIRRLLVFGAIAVMCLLLGAFTPIGRYFTVAEIQRLADALGYWGPVAILLIGIFSPLLFLPRWPVAFVSGLLYGIAWGTVLATVASSIGAWLHFLLAQTLLSPVSDRLRRRYGIKPVESLPADKVFSVLFLLRAFPLSNFVATNLLAGALRIRLHTYLAASFFGMIPSTVMYAAWGKLLKKPSPQYYALAVAILVLLLLGTWMAQRRFYPWFKQIGRAHV